ncbi:MAG TPA: hypothetical protein VH639_18130 [Bryobacteraceae bacterium]
MLQPALADWGAELTQEGDRKQPVQFSSTSRRNDALEIALPEGFVVDELPPAVALDTGTVAYRSKI